MRIKFSTAMDLCEFSTMHLYLGSLEWSCRGTSGPSLKASHASLVLFVLYKGAASSVNTPCRDIQSPSESVCTHCDISAVSSSNNETLGDEMLSDLSGYRLCMARLVIEDNDTPIHNTVCVTTGKSSHASIVRLLFPPRH